MSNPNDFLIENCVLEKYVGPGGNVVVPEGVTSIGNGAFRGCDSLTSITLPEGVTKIGNGAFQNCANLTAVTLPDSPLHIASDAFQNDHNLTQLILPRGVQEIEAGAFQDSGLTAIRVDPENERFISVDGVLFSKDGTQLLIYPNAKSGDYIAPEGVRAVANHAFSWCHALTSATFQSGLVSIGPFAFVECTQLQSVHLPDGLKTIGIYAFCSCISLKSVILPDGLLEIGENAFRYCTALRSVTIPDSVKTIGEGAFRQCSNLIHAALPMEYAEISENLFASCGQLISVTGAVPLFREKARSAVHYNIQMIPPVVLLQREDVDISAEDLKETLEVIKKKKKELAPLVISMNDGFAMQRFLHLWKKVKLDELDEYIRMAGEKNCSETLASLMDYKKNVYSAKDVEKAEKESIQKAVGEKELSVSDWRKVFKLSIRGGEAAILQYLGNDSYVIVPDHIGKNKVVGVDRGAFEDRKDVVSVALPEGLIYIDSYAFARSGITEIEIPASVKNIGYCAFSNCAALKEIRVRPKNKVYKSQNGALYDKKQTILFCWPGAGGENCRMPETVERIEGRAFASCGNLKEIIFSPVLKDIGSEAFGRCTQLKALVFPAELASLGIAAFSGCTGLESIEFTDKTCEILEKSAFEGCSALKEIRFGQGLQKIYWHAFQGCTALTGVTLGPETVMLGKEAFTECSGLEVIHIPAGVMSIGADCFGDCPKLTIHAPAGSCAEQYAKDNNIPFEAE